MKNENQRKRSKIIGWTIAVIAIAVYILAVYQNVGRGG